MNRQLFEESFDNNETESVTVQNFRQIQDAASCKKRGHLNFFFFWGGELHSLRIHEREVLNVQGLCLN